MSEVARILSQTESGDSAAAEELLPLVYNELRRLADRNGIPAFRVHGNPDGPTM